VASFLGETNIFEGEAGRSVAVRPERVRLLPPGSAVPSGCSSLPGEIRDLVYLGDREHAIVELGSGADFRVDLRKADHAEGRVWKRGDAVMVAWRPDDAHPLADG
jgi:putative spermidine/putrescine transport system ATP-binding protein